MTDSGPIPFATQQWLDRFVEVLEGSAAFRMATAGWNDDSLFIVDVDPDAGWETPVGFYMKWKRGKLVEAVVTEDVTRRAVFRVTAKYGDWAHGYHSRMDAAVAFLTGKFTFKGPFAKAALNVAGETMMVQHAFDVPSVFLSPKEATGVRA